MANILNTDTQNQWQNRNKIEFKNLNEHEKCTKDSNRIVKNVNKKKKKKYTINHRKAVNEMKKFRQNYKRFDISKI
jgi:hypothetical protein